MFTLLAERVPCVVTFFFSSSLFQFFWQLLFSEKQKCIVICLVCTIMII